MAPGQFCFTCTSLCHYCIHTCFLAQVTRNTSICPSSPCHNPACAMQKLSPACKPVKSHKLFFGSNTSTTSSPLDFIFSNVLDLLLLPPSINININFLLLTITQDIPIRSIANQIQGPLVLPKFNSTVEISLINPLKGFLWMEMDKKLKTISQIQWKKKLKQFLESNQIANLVQIHMLYPFHTKSKVS